MILITHQFQAHGKDGGWHEVHMMRCAIVRTSGQGGFSSGSTQRAVSGVSGLFLGAMRRTASRPLTGLSVARTEQCTRDVGDICACLLALVAGGGRRLRVGQGALQAGRTAGMRQLVAGGRLLQTAGRLAQLADADAVVGRRFLQQAPRGEGPGICVAMAPWTCRARWPVYG